MTRRASGGGSRRTTTASFGAVVVAAALLVPAPVQATTAPWTAAGSQAAAAGAQAVAGTQLAGSGAVVADANGQQRLLIGWSPATDAAQRAAVLATAALDAAERVTDHVDVVTVPPDRVAAVTQRLTAASVVTAVEVDRWLHHAAEPPTDPLFDQQWSLHNTGEPIDDDTPATAGIDVRALEAWDVTRGSEDVVVAVIDSGVDPDHPDLAGALWTNPDEVEDDTDSDGNGFVDDLHGWNFAGAPEEESNDTFISVAEDWHGTAVASVIAARAGDTGMVGLAPEVRIMVLKTFTGEAEVGRASLTDMLEAFDYAAANGADIINASWFNPASSDLLYDAVGDADVPVVAAAGNDQEDLSDGTPAAYPAAFTLPNLVSVTAIGPEGLLADFANYGRTEIEVAAPGVAIVTARPGAQWQLVGGTSFAAPLVSAALALARSAYPDAATTELVDAVSWTSRVVEGATDVTITGGMLDAAALLDGVERPICGTAGHDTELFADVDPANPHAEWLRCLRATEVANGTVEGNYLPAHTISRAQLATLLVGALEAVGVPVPAEPADAFGDDDGSAHEPAIDRLAALGIAAGNTERRFNPNQPVTRGQLAAFVVRAYEVAVGVDQEPSRDWFDDDDRSTHADAIDTARDLGLVRGVATLRFAPEDSSRRDQVASLVARLLDAVARHGGAAPGDQ